MLAKTVCSWQFATWTNRERKILHMINYRYALVLIGVCFFFGPSASGAQEPELTVPVVNPLQPPEGENWIRLCEDESDPNSCRIVQNLFLERDVDGQKQRLGRILQIIVLYASNRDTGQRELHISMNLPLGIDLRPGAVVMIDDGEEFQLPFLQCVNDGCAVSRLIDEDLLNQLRLGTQLKVGFRAWGNEAVTIIPASLIGFTRAFGSIQ